MLTCSSSMALYHQPSQALLGGIITGELSPEDHLPPQRELTVAYRVSRDTGRNTITDLKDKSYIRREESKSTVFAPSRIQHGILTLTSLSTDIRGRRMTPGSERLTLRREPAQARIARELSLNEGDEVWFVERLRFADSDVVSLNLSYLSLPQDVTLTEDDLRQDVSLWKLLAERGILFSESAEVISAIAAENWHAKLLDVTVGAPLLQVEGVTYSVRGRPVEFHQIIARADRYRYDFAVSR